MIMTSSYLSPTNYYKRHGLSKDFINTHHKNSPKIVCIDSDICNFSRSQQDISQLLKLLLNSFICKTIWASYFRNTKKRIFINPTASSVRY